MSRLAHPSLPKALRRFGMIGLTLVALPPAAAPDTPRRNWQDFPALTRIWVENGRVRAATDPDSTGRSWRVELDSEGEDWSRPIRGEAPPPVDSLAAVRVFDGSLFDKFPVERVSLGDGFAVMR